MARFRKTVLRQGPYVTRSGEVLDVTPARAKAWADKVNLMRSMGIKIPIGWGHQPAAAPIDPNADPDDVDSRARREYLMSALNAGFIDSAEFDPRTGNLDLLGEVPGADLSPSGDLLAWVKLNDGREVRTAIKECSVGINDWRDGRGRTWNDSVIHLALCVLPVVDGQDGFKALSILPGRPGSAGVITAIPPVVPDSLPSGLLCLSLSQFQDSDLTGLSRNSAPEHPAVVMYTEATGNPAELFLTLLHAATSAHLLHLGTKSFAAHMALGELYTALPGLVDGLIEAWQGKHDLVSGWPGGYAPPAGEPAKFVEDLCQYLLANRAAVGEDSELQNIVDEIEAALDSASYKLRFLS